MNNAVLYNESGREIEGLLTLDDCQVVGDVSTDSTFPMPIWIVEHPDLSDRAVTLWLRLRAALSSQSARLAPSRSSLANLLGVGDTSARKALYELRGAGAVYIERTFQGGRQRQNLIYLWPAKPLMTRVSGLSESEVEGVSMLTPVLSLKLSNNLSTSAPKGRQRKIYSPEFEEVWKLYPHQINKAGASRAYEITLASDDVTSDVLKRAVQNYAAEMLEEGRDKRHILHASTFFGRDERWRYHLDGTNEPYVLSAEQLRDAECYEMWDAGDEWWDEDLCELTSDNPLSRGIARPRDAKDRLVDTAGLPYTIDAQGRRRTIGDS